MAISIVIPLPARPASPVTTPEQASQAEVTVAMSLCKENWRVFLPSGDASAITLGSPPDFSNDIDDPMVLVSFPDYAGTTCAYYLQGHTSHFYKHATGYAIFRTPASFPG